MLLLLAACGAPADSPAANRASPVEVGPPISSPEAGAGVLAVDPVVLGRYAPLYLPADSSAPPPAPGRCAGGITAPQDPYNPDIEPIPADPHAEVYGPEADPRHLRAQWMDDPAQSFALVWRTDADTLSSVVQVGSASGVDATVYGASFPLSPDPSDGRVHEARICGLVPGTSYTWRVGGADHWSAERTLTTAPLPGSAWPFRFAVAGDSRDGYDTWAAVLAGVATHGVAFRVLTGDAVARGSEVAEWEEWLDAGVGYEDVAPTVMVNGNHDGLAFPFLALNALPGNERTFSFDYANAHFVVLNDTVTASGEWASQTAWLAADLAATTQTWRFVFHHKPAFTASQHAGDGDVRQWFVPIEEAGGVAIDFAGHNHNYERSAPLLGGMEAPPETGTTYVVTAGAGAPLYENFGDSPTMLVGQSVNHYVIVSVDGANLELTAIDLAGNVIDRLVLTR